MNQIQLNLAGMVLGWFHVRQSHSAFKMAAVNENISLLVYCCFIIRAVPELNVLEGRAAASVF